MVFSIIQLLMLTTNHDRQQAQSAMLDLEHNKEATRRALVANKASSGMTQYVCTRYAA